MTETAQTLDGAIKNLLWWTEQRSVVGVPHVLKDDINALKAAYWNLRPTDRKKLEDFGR